MTVHDLADAYLTVIYGAAAWSAGAASLAIVVLAGAVTGMWRKQP